MSTENPVVGAVVVETMDARVPGATKSGPSGITEGLSVIGDTTAPENYQFIGSRYTVVNRTLKPGETFVAEPGSFMTSSENIKMGLHLGGFSGAVGGQLSGEGFARAKFTNKGDKEGYVSVTPNQPMACVIPVDTRVAPMYCKRGAYFAGDEKVQATAKILPSASCLACCCGGLAPIIQEVNGRGDAFLTAGGTVIKKTLADGESIVVDTESVVAFSYNVGYDVKRVGNCTTCLFGGEACFNTVLTGPGDVYVQSYNYQKLIDLLVVFQPSLPCFGDK